MGVPLPAGSRRSIFPPTGQGGKKFCAGSQGNGQNTQHITRNSTQKRRGDGPAPGVLGIQGKVYHSDAGHTPVLRRPNMIRRMGQLPVPHNVTTLRNYVHALQQLRAYTTVTITQQQAQPQGGSGLFDEESDDDVHFWKTKERVVGREEYTHKYVCPNATRHTPEDGQVPPGFVPCTINGIPCYHNQKPRKGTAWHGDGSKLRDHQTGAPRAGAAATCGPLQIHLQSDRPTGLIPNRIAEISLGHCPIPTRGLPHTR